MRLTHFRHKKILFNICLVMCFVLLGSNAVLSVRFKDALISVGNIEFPISSINGCVQVIISLLCIVMVLTERKKGIIWSHILLILSITGALRTIFVSRTMSTAPGAFNAVIFLIAITLISKQIKYSDMMAVTDTVTGLLNRYGFDHDIKSKLWANEQGRVAIVHLDGFWPVNANLGRKYGDELLKIVAERIRVAIEGKGTAYKIEGAEFAILLPNTPNYIGIVASVIKSIEETITISKDDVPSNCYLSAFAGISDFGEQGTDVDTIMKRADIAVNYAIKSGNNKFCTFNDEMKESIARQAHVERLVKDSLINGWFYLVYQPQYTIDDRRLRGFETLIRMNAPGGEKISPGEFIGIAERSDLVLDIDRFVIKRAMEEFREICYSSGNTITLAVNISAKDIARAGFAERLFELMEEVSFPAECLEIEITEYSFAEEGSHTIENIKKLRDHQIMIALDDFGTGYTALEQLMKLPVNLVKIDKSLIDNLVRNEMNIDFVKSVIYMGHLMDAEVIAEGVEYDSQVECLRELDCDFIQGFIWGKPMEYDEARELSNTLYDKIPHFRG